MGRCSSERILIMIGEILNKIIDKFDNPSDVDTIISDQIVRFAQGTVLFLAFNLGMIAACMVYMLGCLGLWNSLLDFMFPIKDTFGDMFLTFCSHWMLIIIYVSVVLKKDIE